MTPRTANSLIALKALYGRYGEHLRTTPVDPTFNAAVLRMAGIVCPTGFDVKENAEDAPSTYEELLAYVDEHQRLRVWAGASDNTIFGDAEVNLAFRAWHDWTHYTYKHDFSFEGECMTAEAMKADLLKIYPGASKVWLALIDAEVAGQAGEYQKTGEFVQDQRSYALGYLGNLPYVQRALND